MSMAVAAFLNKKVNRKIVRDENEKLIVEAVFSREDNEFILRREIGKTKSFSYTG